MPTSARVILIVTGVVVGLVILAAVVVGLSHLVTKKVYSKRTFLSAPKDNPHLSRAYQHIDELGRTDLKDAKRTKEVLDKIHGALSDAYPSGEIPPHVLAKHELNWEKHLSSPHFFKLNELFQ